MHSVSRVDEAAAQTPQLHGSHGTDFGRATYVDHRVGSVSSASGRRWRRGKRRRVMDEGKNRPKTACFATQTEPRPRKRSVNEGEYRC